MNLEIYQKRQSEEYYKFNFPCLSLRKESTYFNRASIDIIGNFKEWTIAKDKDTNTYYLAFLTGLEGIKGFTLKRKKENASSTTSSKGIFKKFNDLKMGVYKICIDEVKVANDIEWYPLDFINESDLNDD